MFDFVRGKSEKRNAEAQIFIQNKEEVFQTRKNGALKIAVGIGIKFTFAPFGNGHGLVAQVVRAADS